MTPRIAALRAARELEPVEVGEDKRERRRLLFVERAELRHRLTKKGQAEMRARISEITKVLDCERG